MESEPFASVWDAIETTPGAAAEMKRRWCVMMALQEHITSVGIPSRKPQDVTTSRVSDLVQGKTSQFGLDELVRMVVAAGLIVSDEAAATI